MRRAFFYPDKATEEQEVLKELWMVGRSINAAKKNKKPLEFVEHVKEAQAEVDRNNKRWELLHLLETQPQSKTKNKREGKRQGMERRESSAT